MARLMMPSALLSGEVVFAETWVVWADAASGKNPPNIKSISKRSSRVEVTMVKLRESLKAQSTEREKRGFNDKTTETPLLTRIVEN